MGKSPALTRSGKTTETNESSGSRAPTQFPTPAVAAISYVTYTPTGAKEVTRRADAGSSLASAGTPANSMLATSRSTPGRNVPSPSSSQSRARGTSLVVAPSPERTTRTEITSTSFVAVDMSSRTIGTFSAPWGTEGGASRVADTRSSSGG